MLERTIWRTIGPIVGRTFGRAMVCAMVCAMVGTEANANAPATALRRDPRFTARCWPAGPPVTATRGQTKRTLPRPAPPDQRASMASSRGPGSMKCMKVVIFPSSQVMYIWTGNSVRSPVLRATPVQVVQRFVKTEPLL